jgi:hypothetical protein
MQSRSRLLRATALAGLLAGSAFGCAQDPKTHTQFTAVTNLPTASGAGGSTGAAGSSGGAGATMSNPDASTINGGMTVGCGMDPMQPVGTYFQYQIPIAGPDLDANNQPKVRTRTYFVRLPTGYDSTKPYRVVYLGPGCGGNAASDVLRLYTYSMTDAILVAIMPLPEFGACFDESVKSVEYPFFDAVHKKIEAAFCVDPTRQFYAGFSTGARLGFMLNCAFPDVLRATSSIQGGLPPLPACVKHPIAMFTVSDTLETGNPYSEGVKAAQGVFAQNGCTGTFMSPMPPGGCGTACTPYDTMAMPLNANTPNCVKYVGCPADYPVIFCTSQGAGHITYEPWSDQALWTFFKSF